MSNEYTPQIEAFFPEAARDQAKQELGLVALAQEQTLELVTPIDSVFKQHGVPVRTFETARVAVVEGVTKEFSMRRDDLVHHAAIAETADYDPTKVIMPVIIGPVNPVVLRTEKDIKEGPSGFMIPAVADADGNEGRSQCVVVTGELLEKGYGLGMLVADCSVENVVVTKKGEPENMVAIAQTHNGWRESSQGTDVELQKTFAEEGWLDQDSYDIYISPSAGVMYGFEMPKQAVADAMKQRGTDVQGVDRTTDYAWGVGPQNIAEADNAEYKDMAASTDADKAFLNVALTAHLNHIVSLGLQSNETAFSDSWRDSFTDPNRPSDRRANVRGDKEARAYRMMVALLPEQEKIMSEEGRPNIDYEAELERYRAIPEFRELEAEIPDAIQMMTSYEGEKGLTGQDHIDYWNNIGKGLGGFYDDIRENGCSSCGSHTPGCCDGCA
jgi:hypothetical protein